MAEFLQRIGGDIFEAKSLPDADLAFLIQLETLILQKLRAPIDQMMGQMEGAGAPPADAAMAAAPMIDPTAAQAGMGGMPMIPPMPGGGPPPVGQVPGGGERMRGMRMEPNMPNPDELRRMLGGAR